MRKSSASPQQQSYGAQEVFFVLTIADFLLRVQIFVGHCFLVLQTIADATEKKTNDYTDQNLEKWGSFWMRMETLRLGLDVYSAASRRWDQTS